MRAKTINEIVRGKSGLGTLGVGKVFTQKKIMEWLSKHNIHEYSLYDDLSIHVYTDVDISDEDIPEFPDYINFKKIEGDFDCSECGLTRLRGCPEIVEGSFGCQFNNLTSLEGAPIRVEGSFHCNYNTLVSLKGSPKFVGHSFFCQENQLSTLEGGPTYVNHKYKCSHNNLISLKGAPLIVETLICDNNELINFDGGPQDIIDELQCEGNKLTISIDEIKQKYTKLNVSSGDFHFIHYENEEE